MEYQMACACNNLSTMAAPSCFLILVVSCNALLRISVEAYPYPPVAAGLSFDFYESTCPSLEYTVRQYLKRAFENDAGLAAGLLRLHFHDCFVQGCDGSILLDEWPSEKAAPPNLTLRPEAFEAINELKALVDAACGQVVSCSDLTVLAARDSVYWSGGPGYSVPLGRRDCRRAASIDEVIEFIPDPTSNVTVLLDAFGKHDLDAVDLVAFSGSHTIGVAHCTSFEDRLFPCQDPTLEEAFAEGLYATCPAPGSCNVTALDCHSPEAFDNSYYVGIVNGQRLLTSDQELYGHPSTETTVSDFAANQSLFLERFVYSMGKMGQLGVLTEEQGEIRENCSAVNFGSKEGAWSVVGYDGGESRVF